VALIEPFLPAGVLERFFADRITALLARYETIVRRDGDGVSLDFRRR
jgi:hypothetical protein